MVYLLKEGYKVLINEKLLVSSTGALDLTTQEIEILRKHEYSPLSEEDMHSLSPNIREAFTKEIPASNPTEERDEWIINQLKTSDLEPILELGAGTKARLKDKIFAYFYGVKYWGIDLLKDPAGNNIQGNFLTTYPVTQSHIVILEEVIEHLHPEDITKLIDLCYNNMAKKLIITTPNNDFTLHVLGRKFRHHDHKFEWNEKDLSEFTEKIKATYACDIQRTQIGHRIKGHTATWGIVISFCI